MSFISDIGKKVGSYYNEIASTAPESPATHNTPDFQAGLTNLLNFGREAASQIKQATRVANTLWAASTVLKREDLGNNLQLVRHIHDRYEIVDNTNPSTPQVLHYWTADEKHRPQVVKDKQGQATGVAFNDGNGAIEVFGLTAGSLTRISAPADVKATQVVHADNGWYVALTRKEEAQTVTTLHHAANGQPLEDSKYRVWTTDREQPVIEAKGPRMLLAGTEGYDLYCGNSVVPIGSYEHAGSAFSLTDTGYRFYVQAPLPDLDPKAVSATDIYATERHLKTQLNNGVRHAVDANGQKFDIKKAFARSQGYWVEVSVNGPNRLLWKETIVE